MGGAGGTKGGKEGKILTSRMLDYMPKSPAQVSPDTNKRSRSNPLYRKLGDAQVARHIRDEEGHSCTACSLSETQSQQKVMYDTSNHIYPRST